jgi:DNA-binding response OmpR family regulator
VEPTHALIVDDDKDTANLFKAILGLVGFECTALYSAKMAFAYLANCVPELILLDLRLGLELDGKDILYQIRSNPRFDKTRVIVITAYPGMLDQIENLADLVLLKPVEFEDLTTLSSRLTQMQPKTYLFRDPVSDLYSLNFFMTRLEHISERGKRNPDLIYAVAAIEFQVNIGESDRLSDEDSIQLLKQLSARLNKNFRPTDTFGHLEGLRVLALYEDLKKADDISIIIERLHKDHALAVEIKGRSLQVSPAIGAVLNHPALQDPEIMVKTAVQTLDQVLKTKDQYFSLANPASFSTEATKK